MSKNHADGSSDTCCQKSAEQEALSAASGTMLEVTFSSMGTFDSVV